MKAALLLLLMPVGVLMGHGIGQCVPVRIGTQGDNKTCIKRLYQQAEDGYAPHDVIALTFTRDKPLKHQPGFVGEARVEKAFKINSNYYVKVWLSDPTSKDFYRKYMRENKDRKADLECSPSQEFWDYNKEKWASMIELKEGDELYSYGKRKIVIDRMELVRQHKTLYGLSVEHQHNFFCTYCDILTHNNTAVVQGNGMGMAMEVGIQLLWGAGGVVIGGPFLAFSIAGIAIMGAVSFSHDSVPVATVDLGYDDDLFYLMGNQIVGRDYKAPGNPELSECWPGWWKNTEWVKGKALKVMTLKGKFGYRDARGWIWVPTGPEGSPLSHGGAQWDVNHPREKDNYRNVFPGTKKEDCPEWK